MSTLALTDSMVRSLAAADKGQRIEITDARCMGLVLRVTDTGAKSWAFKFWSKLMGRAVRITMGSYPTVSLVSARRQADKFREAVAQGRDPRGELAAQALEARSAMTFEVLATRYIEDYAKPNKASWKADEGLLKAPRAKWDDRVASSITEDEAATFLMDLAKVAPASANRTQSVLHKMFAWGREPGRRFVSANPFTDLPRQGREVPKDRVLTDLELVTLWRGLDDPKLGTRRDIALALRMIYLTMARPGEVAGATRDELQDLDGDAPEWHLPSGRTKNRRPHLVPLSPMAVAVITEAMPDDQEVVFPSRFSRRMTLARNSLSQGLIEIRVRLGLTVPFTPHDLRRTAATNARRDGAVRSSVKALLNHIEGDVTGIYDQYEMLKEKQGVVTIVEEGLKRRLASLPATGQPHPQTTLSSADQSEPA
jgi:integrase